ncbi:hypothetical protein Hanom_Chr10g00933271 [Helianthus anomalus]
MNTRFVRSFMFVNARLCSFIYVRLFTFVCVRSFTFVHLCPFQFKYITSYIYINIKHKRNFLSTYLNITN